MTPFQVELENNINKMLQRSYLYERQLEKEGKKDLALQVRRATSVLAEHLLKEYKISECLKDFWKDKASLAEHIN